MKWARLHCLSNQFKWILQKVAKLDLINYFGKFESMRRFLKKNLKKDNKLLFSIDDQKNLSCSKLFRRKIFIEIMSLLLLYFAISACQQAYCQLLLNDKNHYQTGILLPKTNHEIIYAGHPQNPAPKYYNYNFELAFASTPSVIYFFSGLNSQGGAVVYQNWLTNSQYSLKMTFTIAGFSACTINYFAISNAVQSIKMINSWELNLQNINFANLTKEISFSSWNFFSWKGFAFSQGYEAQNSSKLIISILSFNSTSVTLTINASLINKTTVSIIFFERINDFFAINFAIVQNPAITIPTIRPNQLALGFVGLKSLIGGTQRQMFFCNVPANTTNLPYCEDQALWSNNIYQFTVIYFRSVVCIPGVDDTNINRTTCQCFSGFEYGATNDVYVVCVPTLRLIDVLQNFNQISLKLSYILNVEFALNIQGSIQIIINGQPATPDNIVFQNGTININLTMITHSRRITVFVPSKSTQRIDTKELLLQHNATINEYFYQFSSTELYIFDVSRNFLQNSTELIQKIQSLGVAAGCIGYLINVIEFSQQICLYLFVSIKFPYNVKTVLQIIYASQGFMVLPIRLNPPYQVYDDDFNRPQIYEKYYFSFNFISENFYALIKFFILIVVYFVGDKLSAYLPNSGFLMIFGKPIKAAYFLKFYRNCLEFLLSCQIYVVFGMLVTMMDRRLNNYYKIINFLFAITLIFIIEIVVIAINPTIKVYNEEKRYKRKMGSKTFAPKNYKNEFYTFVKYLSFFIFALTVPYTSGPTCLSITLICLILKTIAAFRADHQGRFSKMSSILQSILSVVINASLLIAELLNQNGVDPYWFNIAGYGAAGAIVLKMVFFEFEILFECIMFLKNLFDKLCFKQKSKQRLSSQQNQKHHQRNQINFIRKKQNNNKKIQRITPNVMLISPIELSEYKFIEGKKQKKHVFPKRARVRPHFDLQVNVKQFLSNLQKKPELITNI